MLATGTLDTAWVEQVAALQQAAAATVSTSIMCAPRPTPFQDGTSNDTTTSSSSSIAPSAEDPQPPSAGPHHPTDLERIQKRWRETRKLLATAAQAAAACPASSQAAANSTLKYMLGQLFAKAESIWQATGDPIARSLMEEIADSALPLDTDSDYYTSDMAIVTSADLSPAPAPTYSASGDVRASASAYDGVSAMDVSAAAEAAAGQQRSVLMCYAMARTVAVKGAASRRVLVADDLQQQW